MHLHYLDRGTYRQKSSSAVRDQLIDTFGESYVIPEGGTNEPALEGCAELATEIEHQLEEWPDYLAAACGTGGTLAGLIRGSDGRGQILGVSSLKGNWMPKEIAKLLGESQSYSNWQILSQYHFGGYAKFPSPLQAFCEEFTAVYGIRLDPIYTSKLFYGILDQIRKGCFPKGSKVLVVHSGGLQGWNDRLMRG
jgi:1-aminocyclopropane-1-carboxylate deaminase/D-cysteine desulfhydrase-like pyridoxal-dependent ACC family enzyme